MHLLFPRIAAQSIGLVGLPCSSWEHPSFLADDASQIAQDRRMDVFAVKVARAISMGLQLPGPEEL